MNRLARISALFAGLYVLTACTEHDWTVRLSEIDDTSSAGIVTPASFRVGVPDTVSITTVGNGCVRMANTQVQVQGLLATIQPVDSNRIRDICTDTRRTFIHKAGVTFQQAGSATLRILGRTELLTNIIVERSVPVQ